MIMSRIFKGKMQTLTETIKLTDKKKLHNVTVDGRSISRNVAHLNILVRDVIKLLYYEYWTEKQKYFYVENVKLFNMILNLNQNMLLKVHYQKLKRKKINLHVKQILQKNPA